MERMDDLDRRYPEPQYEDCPFEVGDKVRVKTDEPEEAPSGLKGKVGAVSDFNVDCQRWYISVDGVGLEDGDGNTFATWELEKVA